MRERGARAKWPHRTRLLFVGDEFFEHPILNSPYAYPGRHWELDEAGQPTQQVIEKRRVAAFITTTQLAPVGPE